MIYLTKDFFYITSINSHNNTLDDSGTHSSEMSFATSGLSLEENTVTLTSVIIEFFIHKY